MITRQQLDEVLERQREDRRRLGTLLVESGLISETQVTQILSQQLSVPWVSLYHIDFSRQLLNLVPSQVVERFCLVPIFVRRVRGLGQTLYVAMDDPTDEAALEQVRQFSGLPVRAMIAPPSDIRAAIRVYYGTTTAGGAEPSDPMAVPTTAEPKRPPPKPPQPPRKEAPSELDIEVEVESPEPPLAQAAVSEGSPEVAGPTSEAAPPSTKLSASEPPTPSDASDTPDQGETEPPPAMAGAPSVNIPPSSHPPDVAPAAEPEATAEVPQDFLAGGAEDIPTEAPPAVSAATPSSPPSSQGADGGYTGLEPTPSSRAPSQPDEPPRSLTPVPESSRVPARDVVMPQPRTGKTPRMVSLTLLDGTTINLPARSAQSPRAEPEAEVEPAEAGEDQLTARDLVAALRAVSHGADATEILGENARWESMFAALLSLLLKKRLIADWEFVEEYKRV
ncbi:MAG: hypothetical protein H6718_24330 [Polyangiaceae bacterium]|nr:hypothetical protein [Polyangiaceae bacterium]